MVHQRPSRAAHSYRTIAFLTQLVSAVEAQGWSISDTEQGLALAPDGETIGFRIDENTSRVPHVRNRKEEAEWTDYQRRLEQHSRGIGYSPWPPRIPEHDHVPNGQLLLRLDNDRVGEGLRRTFGDGKTQTLEALLPVIRKSLQVWADAKKKTRMSSAPDREPNGERSYHNLATIRPKFIAAEILLAATAEIPLSAASEQYSFPASTYP